MRAVFGLVMAVLFGFAFSGCVVTTKNVEVERADQGIAGNRGFFKGTPPPAESRKATRQHVDIDVELPHVSKEARSFEVKDTVTKSSNNPGIAAQPARQVIAEEPEVTEEMPAISEEQEVIEEEIVQPAAQPVEAPKAAPIVEVVPPSKKYIVQKNDTLQKIAARPEIYGDGSKWHTIYKANKDKLKSPDKIRPGQELTIPPAK